MKIKFLYVSAQYFRSFKSFHLDLQAGGISLVQGELLGDLESVESNGSGKSSLFSAISWALYGRLPHISGKDVTGDDVISWGTNKGCYVKVAFKIGDDTYEVIRFRQDPTYGNKVRIWLGEDEKTLASNPQTQKLIEEIVGISQDLFAQLVYITDASMRNSFSFETDANRKKILVDVLPHLRQFGQARDRVKDAHDVFNENHKRLNQELETLNQMIEALPDMAESKKQSALISERIAKLEDQRIDLQSKLTDCENLILDCTRILKEHDSALKAASESESLARKKYEIEREKYNQKVAQRKMIERDYTRWLNAKDECPECSQKIPLQLKQIQRSHHKCQLDLEIMCEEAYHLSCIASEESLRKAEHDKNEVSFAFNRIGQEKSSYEQERERILNAIAQIKQEKANLENIRTHLESECQTAADRRRALDSRVSEIQRLLETVAVYIDPLKFWLQGFGPKGVISLALKQTLDLLTERTNHWLYRLWHEGASIVVGFPQEDISKITVDFIINGKSVNIISLSSGQTRRLCLALCFGLRETLQSLSGWQTNLLVLDEVFDSLDNAGRLQVLEKMREIKDTSIFVISQFPHVSGPIDHMINVQYDHGVSKII